MHPKGGKGGHKHFRIKVKNKPGGKEMTVPAPCSAIKATMMNASSKTFNMLIVSFEPNWLLDEQRKEPKDLKGRNSRCSATRFYPFSVRISQRSYYSIRYLRRNFSRNAKYCQTYVIETDNVGSVSEWKRKKYYTVCTHAFDRDTMIPRMTIASARWRPVSKLLRIRGDKKIHKLSADFLK